MTRTSIIRSFSRLGTKAVMPPNMVVRSIHSSASLFNAAQANAAGSKTADEATLQRIAGDILDLDFVQMNQFLKVMQTKRNIPNEEFDKLSGASSMTAGGGKGGADAAAAVEEVKEKDAFTIKIGAVDAKAKIKVIKEVRTITGLGLKEAKELVEKAPVVLKEGIKKEEAENFKKLLTEAGATVEVL